MCKLPLEQLFAGANLVWVVICLEDEAICLVAQLRDESCQELACLHCNQRL